MICSPKTADAVVAHIISPGRTDWKRPFMQFVWSVWRGSALANVSSACSLLIGAGWSSCMKVVIKLSLLVDDQIQCAAACCCTSELKGERPRTTHLIQRFSTFFTWGSFPWTTAQKIVWQRRRRNTLAVTALHSEGGFQPIMKPNWLYSGSCFLGRHVGAFIGARLSSTSLYCHKMTYFIPLQP